MRLGDLSPPLNTEHGQPDQELPVGLRLPADIAGQAGAARKAATTPVGDPAKNVYTVSTYDSRPPNATDIIIDQLHQLYFAP